jgi:hypothetical protein
MILSICKSFIVSIWTGISISYNSICCICHCKDWYRSQ